MLLLSEAIDFLLVQMPYFEVVQTLSIAQHPITSVAINPSGMQYTESRNELLRCTAVVKLSPLLRLAAAAECVADCERHAASEMVPQVNGLLSAPQSLGSCWCGSGNLRHMCSNSRQLPTLPSQPTHPSSP